MGFEIVQIDITHLNQRQRVSRNTSQLDRGTI